MKRIVTLVAALSICVVCGGMLLGVIDVVPGSAVPDTLAAQLRGGCAGVSFLPICDNATNCWAGIKIAVPDANGDTDYDPGSDWIDYCVQEFSMDCTSCVAAITCGGGGG